MRDGRESMYAAGDPVEGEEGSGRPAPSPIASRSPRSAPLGARVCVVTGANRGLGKATALGLARLGATVVMLGRDERRVARAREEVRLVTGNPNVSFVVADLGELASVRRAAGEIARRYPAIHVLVNNAGVNLASRLVTADGFERTFAVNHLGPFLLTNLLLPLLRGGSPSRIVNVTSWFERFGRIDFDDLQAQTRRYGGLRAYYQSKLANVLFTYELAQRLAGTGVTANCVDPGLVATDLLRDRIWWRPRWLRPLWRAFLLSPGRAARAVVYVASAPKLAEISGRCFGVRRRPKRTSRRSRDAKLRERLWQVSAELTGMSAELTGIAGDGATGR